MVRNLKGAGYPLARYSFEMELSVQRLYSCPYALHSDPFFHFSQVKTNSIVLIFNPECLFCGADAQYNAGGFCIFYRIVCKFL